MRVTKDFPEFLGACARQTSDVDTGQAAAWLAPLRCALPVWVDPAAGANELRGIVAGEFSEGQRIVKVESIQIRFDYSESGAPVLDSQAVAEELGL